LGSATAKKACFLTICHCPDMNTRWEIPVTNWVGAAYQKNEEEMPAYHETATMQANVLDSGLD
jgi:hypothetical protein